MKAHILAMLFGAVVLSALSYAFTIGTVANYVQLASALPWFYTMWRIESLHRKHEEAKRRDR